LKSVARQGLVECIQHELLHPYPVLAEKKGEIVAQFKYTIAIKNEGPIMLSGSIIDPARYNSEFKITDAALVTLLAEPMDKFVPNAKKSVKKEKSKKDNKAKKKKKADAKLKRMEELKKTQAEEK